MMQMQTFSTAGLTPQRRIEYWNEQAGDSLTQLVTEPVDRWNFSAQLTRTEIGQIRIAELFSAPARVQHLRQHIARSRDPKFLLCLQLDGVSLLRTEGREACLSNGDFTLVDTTRPYEMTLQQANRALVVCMPQIELRRRMMHPEAVVGLHMSGSRDMGGLVSSFVRNFWQECSRERETLLSPRFGATILDLVASAYASVPQAATHHYSVATARQEQIRQYIEMHLHDPDLTPASIAAALRISSRYVHQLFNEDEETVARYILRRRLEECARAMTDSAQQHRSVSEIALYHGFNDASHFGRVFRERYGMTPRDYRRSERAN